MFGAAFAVANDVVDLVRAVRPSIEPARHASGYGHRRICGPAAMRVEVDHAGITILPRASIILPPAGMFASMQRCAHRQSPRRARIQSARGVDDAPALDTRLRCCRTRVRI